MKACIKCGATDRYKSGDCKACAKVYKAACYAANSEKSKARANARHAANPEKARADKAAWYAANSEKALARGRAWRVANPEKARAISQNRKARKRNAEGAHTASDIKELMILQKGKCTCCKTSIKDGYHVDHIMPLAKGGSNDRHNLQLLCPTCNQKKHAKHPIDFMQSRGYLC